MTSDSEIRIQLAAACYKNPKWYKPLAEWLGVYEYILPDKRELITPAFTFTNASAVFKFWNYCTLIECCLNPTEQYASWKLIKEF